MNTYGQSFSVWCVFNTLGQDGHPERKKSHNNFVAVSLLAILVHVDPNSMPGC